MNRKIATDNAIYIISGEDFEKVTEMMAAISSGAINAVRIFHSGYYETRVKEYLARKK